MFTLLLCFLSDSDEQSGGKQTTERKRRRTTDMKTTGLIFFIYFTRGALRVGGGKKWSMDMGLVRGHWVAHHVWHWLCLFSNLEYTCWIDSLQLHPPVLPAG